MTSGILLLALLLSGLAVGFASQRSRFCFVSALRDLFLFGATDMTRAVLVSLVTAAAGGSVLGWWLTMSGRTLPIIEGVAPGSTLLGGVLFGTGMVLAGSCIVGAFWRLGEGQAAQLWALAGGFAGTWAYRLLPDMTQPGQTLRISPWLSMGIPAVLVGALWWWQRTRPTEGQEFEASTSSGQWWRAPWPAELGAVVIAGALTLFAASTGSLWSVSRVFWLDDFGALAFVAGLAVGGYLAARLGREWRYRRAGLGASEMVRFAGGVLMGLGARMGWGCTVGVLLNGVAVSAAQPWFWLAGAVAGAWLGALLLRRFLLHMLSV